MKHWRVDFKEDGTVEAVTEITGPIDHDRWVIVKAETKQKASKAAYNLYCARKKKATRARLLASGSRMESCSSPALFAVSDRRSGMPRRWNESAMVLRTMFGTRQLALPRVRSAHATERARCASKCWRRSSKHGSTQETSSCLQNGSKARYQHVLRWMAGRNQRCNDLGSLHVVLLCLLDCIPVACIISDMKQTLLFCAGALAALICFAGGYIKGQDRCKDELDHMERSLQIMQMCSPRLTGNYPADMRRHVAITAMCKELASR